MNFVKILWYPYNFRQNLTKAMHTILSSYDDTSHHKHYFCNYEDDRWSPLVFVSRDLQLIPFCVCGTHKKYVNRMCKQLLTFLFKGPNKFSPVKGALNPHLIELKVCFFFQPKDCRTAQQADCSYLKEENLP